MEKQTKDLVKAIKLKAGIQILSVSPEEKIEIKIGPITQEVTGPVEIIINYD